MQTPTQKIALKLAGADASIVEFELKEEGLHVLAVTVTYQQSLGTPVEGMGAPTRERSFRKLYQFTAMHCVLIRTKATILDAPVRLPPAAAGTSEKAGEDVEKLQPQQQQADVVLEAQIENVSESAVVLERCEVIGKRRCTTLLHDEKMVLKSRDVVQVAFLVGGVGMEEKQREIEGGAGEMERKDAGIGQLVLGWRSQCGEVGVLRTGRLAMPAV